jgi:hypothetical protein
MWWTSALTGVVIGAVLGAGLGELREWWKQRRTTQRVAVTLTVELMAMADMVATCGSLANFAEFNLGKEQRLKAHMLVAQLPPEPTAYRALASQLPLLDVDVASAVVAFYGGTERAKRLSAQDESEGTISDARARLLGNVWRNASGAALVALQMLGKYEPPLAKKNDKAELAQLVTALADVLSKKWPHVVLDERGNYLIGGRVKAPDAGIASE